MIDLIFNVKKDKIISYKIVDFFLSISFSIPFVWIGGYFRHILDTHLSLIATEFLLNCVHTWVPGHVVPCVEQLHNKDLLTVKLM